MRTLACLSIPALFFTTLDSMQKPFLVTINCKIIDDSTPQTPFETRLPYYVQDQYDLEAKLHSDKIGSLVGPLKENVPNNLLPHSVTLELHNGNESHCAVISDVLTLHKIWLGPLQQLHSFWLGDQESQEAALRLPEQLMPCTCAVTFELACSESLKELNPSTATGKNGMNNLIAAALDQKQPTQWHSFQMILLEALRKKATKDQALVRQFPTLKQLLPAQPGMFARVLTWWGN